MESLNNRITKYLTSDNFTEEVQDSIRVLRQGLEDNKLKPGLGDRSMDIAILKAQPCNLGR